MYEKMHAADDRHASAWTCDPSVHAARTGLPAPPETARCLATFLREKHSHYGQHGQAFDDVSHDLAPSRWEPLDQIPERLVLEHGWHVLPAHAPSPAPHFTADSATAHAGRSADRNVRAAPWRSAANTDANSTTAASCAGREPAARASAQCKQQRYCYHLRQYFHDSPPWSDDG